MSHGADRSSLLLPITTGHPGSFHPLRDIMPMQLDNPSSNSNRPTLAPAQTVSVSSWSLATCLGTNAATWEPV